MERCDDMRWKKFLVILAFMVITAWSMTGIGFSIKEIVSGMGEVIRFITVDMIPPDIFSLPDLMQPLLDTIYMSFVAVVVAAVISFVLAYLASSITTPHPILQIAARGLASILRTIPDMVWVLLLVPAYGLGTLAGTMALLIASVGLLTRSFAEALDEVDKGQLEAVKTTGAGWLQTMSRAVLPQFLPQFVSWSLFGWDTNVRSSTVIGMVGAGGLGFAIQSGIKLFQFEEVTMAILMTVVLFIGIEMITTELRRRII